MPTYVVLMNWTDQGIRTARETVQRRDQADALAERHGARIEQVYWTVGPYDIVTINTGNAQNVTDVLQYGSEADDFEFEEVGSTITVSPANTTTCDEQVNQAAAASG